MHQSLGSKSRSLIANYDIGSSNQNNSNFIQYNQTLVGRRGRRGNPPIQSNFSKRRPSGNLHTPYEAGSHFGTILDPTLSNIEILANFECPK